MVFVFLNTDTKTDNSEVDKMGNILDSLLSAHKVDMIVEGCEFHGTKYLTEDGICLKCEDVGYDFVGDVQ